MERYEVEWIKKIKDICIEEARHTGIYPSVMIAQTMLESASGTSNLAVNHFNVLGMTVLAETVGRKITFWDGSVYVKALYHSRMDWADYTQTGSFDKGIELCIRHYGWNMWNTKEYAKAGVLDHISCGLTFEEARIDAINQLYEIVPVYAPYDVVDCRYQKSIERIIETFDLWQYDREFLALGGWDGTVPYIIKEDDRIMEMAGSYQGYLAKPTGSNNVIFNTDYYGHEVSGALYPWCAVFIWDIFRMCQLSHLFYNGKRTNSCKDILKWGKKENLIVPSEKGEYGDIVILNIGNERYSHVGFVYENNNDGTLITYEGNTSPEPDSPERGVFKKIRTLEEVEAVIRPRYNSANVLNNRKDLVYRQKSILKTYAKRSRDRDFCSFGSIPEHVICTFMIMEDVTFFNHNGVSFSMILSSIKNNIKSENIAGASTITQQLCKNLFLTFEPSYTRKLKEISLALKAEKVLTKEQIFELYINTVYFDNGQYGIVNAAKYYFGKEVEELTFNEGFFLAALLPVVGIYNPLRVPELFCEYKNKKAIAHKYEFTEEGVQEILRHTADNLDEDLIKHDPEEVNKYVIGPMINERFGPKSVR